jgi:hypothetical protein
MPEIGLTGSCDAECQVSGQRYGVQSQELSFIHVPDPQGGIFEKEKSKVRTYLYLYRGLIL